MKHEELERHAAWFRYGMGVEDYAGLAAMIFRARYGLVPLTLRSIALFRLEDVALYETGPPHLRSFITQGRRGKYEHAYLLFAGEQTGGEIQVFVSGVTRMWREELHALPARFETADVQVKEAPAGSRRR